MALGRENVVHKLCKFINGSEKSCALLNHCILTVSCSERIIFYIFFLFFFSFVLGCGCPLSFLTTDFICLLTGGKAIGKKSLIEARLMQFHRETKEKIYSLLPYHRCLIRVQPCLTYALLFIYFLLVFWEKPISCNLQTWLPCLYLC